METEKRRQRKRDRETETEKHRGQLQNGSHNMNNGGNRRIVPERSIRGTVLKWTRNPMP